MRDLLFCLTLSAAAAALAGCQVRDAADPEAANDSAPTATAAPTEPAPPASAAIPANAATPAAAPRSSSEAPLAKAATDPALKWGPCPAPLPKGCELTILHGDPAKPNADAMLRIPAGYVIPPHRHSSAERMILVSGRLEVKYQGAAAATLNPGNYAYGPAGLTHRATCTGTEPCHLFIAFEGPVDVLPAMGEVG